MATPAVLEVRQPSFAQIPVNVLMDYNDQHKSLTDEFLVFMRYVGPPCPEPGCKVQPAYNQKDTD